MEQEFFAFRDTCPRAPSAGATAAHDSGDSLARPVVLSGRRRSALSGCNRPDSSRPRQTWPGSSARVRPSSSDECGQYSLRKLARPERFELSTPWFVGSFDW